MRRHIIRWLAIATAAIGAYGCDESLPPRTEPEVVLVPTMSITGPAVVVRFNEAWTGGNIMLGMKNVHDEVLSDKADVTATVTMYLRENPSASRTLTYKYSDIVTPGLVVGNTLTIRVGQSIELMQPWNHRTAAGAAFWMSGIKFNQRADSKGNPYWESDSVHLVVNASLKVFERVQAVKLPAREFTITSELYESTVP
ncbi:MAG: hypothetical protein IT282_02980 [Bacteroidetes bacterium]|nr:hypothetical protein [Bacteroidota bacterium]